MMLTTLRAWEPELWTGHVRRPSHAICRFSPYFPESSHRLMPRTPWTDGRTLCPRRRKAIHPLSSLMSSVLSAPRTLTEMLNDEHRQIEVLSPKIKWQINADKNEAHAELRFPCGLHKSDDIKIELDEAKRTITMNVQRVSGPDNCRMSSWEYKQTLDDSLDLSKLQASVDFKKGLLLLHSPLQLADSTVEASQLIEKKSSNEDKGYNSEEEQPPGSEVSDEDTEVEVDLKTSKDTSQPGGTSGNAIEIEDVGPDEDSDRISISSSESRDSVS